MLSTASRLSSFLTPRLVVLPLVALAVGSAGHYGPKIVARYYRKSPLHSAKKPGSAFDKWKWPAFRKWNWEELSYLQLRIQSFTSFRTAFPQIPDVQPDPASMSPALKSFIDYPLTHGEIIDGKRDQSAPPLVNSIIKQMVTIHHSTHSKEGLVDILAVFITQLFQLGSSSDTTEITAVHDPISLQMGSLNIEGELVVTSRTSTGNLLLDIFEDKFSQTAEGYVAQGRPQIGGYLVASCLHNLGTNPDEYRPQEAFLINLKGTTAKVFHLKMTVETMLEIRKGTVPAAESLISEYPLVPFDLFKKEGRQGFASAMIKIAAYVRQQNLV